LNVGDIILIVPAANMDHSAGFPEVLQKPIPAKVIQINEKRGWYRVEYQLGNRPGCIGHETFRLYGGYHENDSDTQP